MRIIAGAHANRRLTSPARRVRPTSEEVRGQWMDRLADDLPDARVLDLFAGSGALGLEALSRGARSADFVENGAGALHALKANVAALRETKRSRVFKRDAIPFVDALDEDAYDVAFADAPYGSKKLDRVIEAWARTRFSRVLGVEHATDQELPRPELRRETRTYGSVAVTLFRSPRTGPGTGLDEEKTAGQTESGRARPGGRPRRGRGSKKR